MRPAAAIGASILASLALVGAYLALGGASYRPLKVADPCAPRAWRNPHSTTGLAEQIALSALDGAACKLHVSRESLVLAFGSRSELERFGRDRGLSQGQITDAARQGLKRAIADARRVDAIGSLEALALDRIADVIGLDTILRALQGSSIAW